MPARASSRKKQRSTPAVQVESGAAEGHATLTPSPPANDQSKPKRRVNRGLTCSNCRARKTRCDGGQPGCKTCEVYQDQCRYEHLPPLSQILALTQRLQDAEATIQSLQAHMGHRSERAQTTPVSEQLNTIDQSSLAMHSPSIARPSTLVSSRIATASSPDRLGSFARFGEESMDRSLPPKDPTNRAGPSSSLASMSIDGKGQISRADVLQSAGMGSVISVDANGEISFYGPTSNVHEPTHQDLEEQESSKIVVRTQLQWNARELRSYEELALGNAALQSDIPRATMTRLLGIHWSWIGNLFMWVYRPAFMRDMSTGGQYFSQFLLSVICAHTARFEENGAVGDMLLTRARLLLATEIHNPSSIPTVQALLQLSARDLAYGRVSQAWLYSGMAFRMVSDLGLQHSTAQILSLGRLNSEDLEIRRRLFWSCYYWDKAISLYLGRTPMLLELPLSPEPEFLDVSVEDEVWSPYVGDLNLSKIPPGGYPPYKSYAISCFTNSCRLAVILNDIIQNLYSRLNRNNNLDAVLETIGRDLGTWRRKTPPYLVMDPDTLPEISPPPHIITQNLLYHTTVILLHRPFLSSPVHRMTCRRAALDSEKLLLLFDSTFGFTRITYMLAYCIYTSATVLLKDVNEGNAEAKRGMETLLRALSLATSTCPHLQRSLEIITNGLKPPPSSLAPGRALSVVASNGASSTPQPNDPQPLIEHSMCNADRMPGIDAYGGLNLDWTPGPLPPAFMFPDLQFDRGGDNADPNFFSLLDAFPENRFDNYTSDWFGSS